MVVEIEDIRGLLSIAIQPVRHDRLGRITLTSVKIDEIEMAIFATEENGQGGTRIKWSVTDFPGVYPEWPGHAISDFLEARIKIPNLEGTLLSADLRDLLAPMALILENAFLHSTKDQEDWSEYWEEVRRKVEVELSIPTIISGAVNNSSS